MISLIVAMTKNHVIGNQGKIPWRIVGEQRRFKELTTGNTVIMGKRSFEEIGIPLPNRKTIIISATMSYEAENCRTVATLEEAILLAGESDIYVSGGERLYKEALPRVERMYITLIDLEMEGDTFFPEFKEEDFILTKEESFEGEIPYRYLTYERRNNSSKLSVTEQYIGVQNNLSIRIATIQDAKILCNWWNDGKVMAHAGFPKGLGTNEEEIIKLIQQQDGNMRRLILEIDLSPVGEMSYRINNNIAEIGIKICDFTYQEKGFGTKAIKMLIKYLFLQQDVDKIILDTNLKNVRAQHVYEKMGFNKVRVNQDVWKDQLGDLQSSVDYEMEKVNYLIKES